MLASPDVKPFIGYIATTLQAIRIAYAARQGIIPRITRRLNDVERRDMIKSGAVFAFGVEESGIRRWTDGLVWSPSRIVRNFLVYRELNQRSSGRGTRRGPYPVEEQPQGASLDHATNGDLPDHPRSFRDSSTHGAMGPGTFKSNGLIKKTITITVDGSDFHLISYYTLEDIRCGRLEPPNFRDDIMVMELPLDIFQLTNFRFPPKVEAGPDGRPTLVADAYETEAISGVETSYHSGEDESSPLWLDDPNGSRSSSGGAIRIGLPSVDANHRLRPHDDHWPYSTNGSCEGPDHSSSQFEDALRSPSGWSSSAPSTSGVDERNNVLWSSPKSLARIGGGVEGRGNQRDALALLDHRGYLHGSWSPLSPVRALEQSGSSYDSSNTNQTTTEPSLEQQTPRIGSTFQEAGGRAQTTMNSRDFARFDQIGGQHHHSQPHQPQQPRDMATHLHLRIGDTFLGQSTLSPSLGNPSLSPSLPSSPSFLQNFHPGDDLGLHQCDHRLGGRTPANDEAHERQHTHHSPSMIFGIQHHEVGYPPFVSSGDRCSDPRGF